MLNEINRILDKTREKDVAEPKSPDTWRRMCKQADQAKQQTDLVPSSPRDTNSAPSSPRDTNSAPSTLQDRGKRQLTAQDLQKEEWRRVEPGEDGKRPEKLVIPDPGYGGGMLKGIFGVSKEVKEMYQSCSPMTYGRSRNYLTIQEINLCLAKGEYKLSKDFVEYSLDKYMQNNYGTKYIIEEIIIAYSHHDRVQDGTELIVNFCERYQKKHPAEIRDILDYLLNCDTRGMTQMGRCLISICERKFGPNSSKTLDALGNMLMACMKEGLHEEGTEVYERLVARAGRDHPKIAQVLDSMLDKAKGDLRYWARHIYKCAIPIFGGLPFDCVW